MKTKSLNEIYDEAKSKVWTSLSSVEKLIYGQTFDGLHKEICKIVKDACFEFSDHKKNVDYFKCAEKYKKVLEQDYEDGDYFEKPLIADEANSLGFKDLAKKWYDELGVIYTEL